MTAGVALAYQLDRLRPMVGSAGGLTALTGVPVLVSVGSAFPVRSKRRRRREILTVSAAAACLVLAFAGALVLSRQGVRLHLPPALQRLV